MVSPIELFPRPSLLTLIVFPVWIIACGVQNDAHGYLSSLPKYTLPIHPIFNSLIAPHYTCEIIIYLTMAVLGRPEGEWINRTILAATLFVATNLTISARNTKEFYTKVFEPKDVKRRAIMIPGVW
jgi:3-oxo-5-alpha-steroid 4-dehydrogenase 3 / polyprenol reductase